MRNKFKLALSEDEQYKIYKILKEMNDVKLSKLNKKFGRKRLVNVYYAIRKLLKSQGNKQYKRIELNLSPVTLKFYKKCFKFYQSI